MEFNELVTALEHHRWLEYFDIRNYSGKSSIRPKAWVVYLYMSMPFHLAANLSGHDLIELHYEKAKEKCPGLAWESVEKCIDVLLNGENLFSDILQQFLENGDAEFQKIVCLDCLKRFYKYGRFLGATIYSKIKIEEFFWEEVKPVGSA